MRNHFIASLGISVITLMCCFQHTYGQQDPMYTQYLHNKLTINPAYAGSNDLLSVQFLARNQWVGFDGAPKTRTLSVHTPVPGTGLGGGVTYINDQNGPKSQNSLYFDLSYRLNVSETSSLSMGLKAGFDMATMGLSALNIVDPTDPGFQQDYQDNFLANVGFGFYYLAPKFYVGLSAPHIIRQKIANDGFTTTSFGIEKTHIYLIAGTLITVNEVLKIKPSLFMKFVMSAPGSVDLTSHFILYDRVWLGANFRVGESLGMIVQYQVSNQLRLGYSYDFGISELSGYNSGSHEIAVSYDFRYQQKRMITPRYF
ncbi:MAG: type IX secretion system membrane protein PorP/SprF [Bacteroidota bacterium]